MAVKPLYLCEGCNQWRELPAAKTVTSNHGLFVATHYPQAFQRKARWCGRCVQQGLARDPVADLAPLRPSVPLANPARPMLRERAHMLWLRFTLWFERPR